MEFATALIGAKSPALDAGKLEGFTDSLNGPTRY